MLGIRPREREWSRSSVQSWEAAAGALDGPCPRGSGGEPGLSKQEVNSAALPRTSEPPPLPSGLISDATKWHKPAHSLCCHSDTGCPSLGSDFCCPCPSPAFPAQLRPSPQHPRGWQVAQVCTSTISVTVHCGLGNQPDGHMTPAGPGLSSRSRGHKRPLFLLRGSPSCPTVFCPTRDTRLQGDQPTPWSGGAATIPSSWQRKSFSVHLSSAPDFIVHIWKSLP